jgi:hypothetical protein
MTVIKLKTDLGTGWIYRSMGRPVGLQSLCDVLSDIHVIEIDVADMVIFGPKEYGAWKLRAIGP